MATAELELELELEEEKGVVVLVAFDRPAQFVRLSDDVKLDFNSGLRFR